MAKPLSLIMLLVPSIFMLMLMQCLSCPPYKKQSLLRLKSSVLTTFNSLNLSYETSFSILKSWNSNSNCCKWDRVVCSSRSHEISALYLDSMLFMPNQDNNAVNSRIFDPVFHIRSLMFLDVSSNSIQGEIPGKGLANLTKLVHLNMRQNSFNGSIPAELFHLRFLQFLDLSTNSLKGGLSSDVCKLENLRTLKLDENFLGGNIPEQIGNLTKLQQFSIRQNKFSGGIPDSIMNLKGLEVIDLSKNQLVMQIPSEIGNLSNISTLALSKNSFTGVIPHSIL